MLHFISNAYMNYLSFVINNKYFTRICSNGLIYPLKVCSTFISINRCQKGASKQIEANDAFIFVQRYQY